MRRPAVMFAVVMAVACVLTSGCATTSADDEFGGHSPSLRADLERADLALREARLADAEILFRKLSVAHPRLPDVWLHLGNIYARQAQLEAASRAYRDGLRHRPDDGRLWHNLALIELRQSIRTLETASELLPTQSEHRARIQVLHRALLLAGQVPTETAP